MHYHLTVIVRAALVLGLFGQAFFVQVPRVTFAAPVASNPFRIPMAPLASSQNQLLEPAPAQPITDTIPVQPAPVLMNASTGGVAHLSKRVTVEFAPGALRSDTIVSATESAQPNLAAADNTALDPAEPFFIRLQPDIATFDAPVTLTVDLSGFLTFELWAQGSRPMLYYMRPTVVTETITGQLGANTIVTRETIVQEKALAGVDLERNVLIAPLSHFSDYELDFTVMNGEPHPWKFVSNLGGVSPFRGAATFQQPIEVPALPDGTQPQLALAYSSAGTDAKAQDEYKLTNGWSLDVPRITQGVTRTRATEDQNGPFSAHYVIDHDDQYKLNLGGVEYNLIKRSSANGISEYVTESYAPLRILKCDTVTCTGFITYPIWHDNVQTQEQKDVCTNYANVQADSGFWQVWTADGTLYVFGLDAASTTLYDTREQNWPGGSDKYVYQSWYLSRVYSVQRIAQANPTWSAEYQYTEDKHFDHGLDNGGGNCDGRGSDYETNNRLVAIHYGASQGITIGGSSYYSITFEYNISTTRLTTITDFANNISLRQYQIGYDRSNHLTFLTQTTWISPTWVFLPVTTFEFDDAGLMRALNNGYGGRVEYTYWEGQDNHQPTHNKYHNVTKRLVLDGNGNDTAETYSYNAPCFNDQYASCWFGHDNLFYVYGYNDARGGLVGYAQVTQTVAISGGATLAKTFHSFSTITRTLGLELETHSMDSAEKVLQAKTINYLVQPDTQFNLPAGAWFAAPQTVTTYITGGVGTSPYIQVAYAYANTTNGLATSIYEYGLDTVNGDERSTHFSYHPNTDRWIVDKEAWENHYETITGNVGGPTFKTQVILYYDNAASYSTSPTLGLLTHVARGGAGGGYNDTYYAYNGWGSPVVMTDALTHTTRLDYDPTGLFALTSTNALSQSTRYAYFGVNGTPLQDNYGETYGLVKSVTDPNQVKVEYRYDSFGRLVKVIRPLDSESAPTTQYVYYDNYSGGGMRGLKVTEIQRIQSGAVLTQSTSSFYDGLGRIIQQRSDAADSSQQVVVNTSYDAVGQVAWTTVPTFEVRSTDFVSGTDWSSRPHTAMQYDALGRTVRTAGPDGADSITAYTPGNIGTYVNHVDANGHYQFQIMDAYGRLARVDETLETLEDPFTTTNNTLWNIPCCSSIVNETLQFTTTGWANYNRLANLAPDSQGQAVKVEFKIQAGTTWSLNSLVVANPPDGGYRRFGIATYNGGIVVQYNSMGYTNTWQQLTLITPVVYNTWYVVLLRTTSSGYNYVAVWQKDNPAISSGRALTMPANLQYYFMHELNHGTDWIDNYQEMKFQITSYSYSVLDSLTNVVDALGNTTVITYDNLNRKTAMLDPDMGIWSYGYDVGGNLVSQSDAKSQRTCQYYDALNRLNAKVYQSSSTSCPGDPGALRQDGFEGSALPTGWTQGGNITVSGGQVHITGTQTWGDYIRRTEKAVDGQAIQFTFRTNSAGASGIIALETGTWTQHDYRRWAVNIYGGAIYEEMYTGPISSQTYLTQVQANTWYGLLLQVDGVNGFKIAVWPLNNPNGKTIRTEYRPTWAGLSWSVTAYTYSGTFDIDDYTETLPFSRMVSGSTTYASVLRLDDFEGSALPAGWIKGEHVSVSGGQVHITGTQTWGDYIQRTDKLVDGQSLQISFKSSITNALVPFGLEMGAWQQPDYRRWGIILYEGIIYREIYTGTDYNATPLMSLQANTWYEMVLTVDGANGFRAEVWPRDNPSGKVALVESRPAFAGRQWTFTTNWYTGIGDIDTYSEARTVSAAAYTYDDGRLRQDDFAGSALPAGWTPGGSVSVSGGQAHITGTGSWSNQIRRSDYLVDGQSVRLSFRITNTNALATFFLDSGTYGQNDYERWGLYVGSGYIKWDIYDRPTPTQTNIMALQVNTWYEAILQVDGAGEFRIELWPSDNPSAKEIRTATFPSWAGSHYVFMSQTNTGVVDIDDYNETQIYSLGQRTAIRNPSGMTSWMYDQRGRVIRETRVITGVGMYITTYTFDALDRVMTTTYPSGEAVRMTYNAAGQPYSLSSAASTYVSSTTYNALGLPTRVQYGNTLQSFYRYIGIEYTSSITSFGSLRQACVVPAALSGCVDGGTPGALLDLLYTYKANGNVESITDYTNTNQAQHFTYDSLNRLVSAYTDATGNGQYNETYAFDAVGDLTAKAGVTLWYSDTVHKHAVTHVNGVQRYGYDPNGNMITRTESGVTYTQTWDAENRLTSVMSATQTTQYAYDAGGTLVRKTTGAQSTTYVGPHYEVNTTTGVTTSYYFFGNARVAMRQGVTVTYLHGDHLGSTSLTTNANGAVVGQLRYKPFGETRWSSGTTATDRRYTGQLSDESATGLYNYQARFFDPQIGRFISADTIVPDFKNPQALNRYVYVLDNPLQHVDPTGHCPRPTQDQGPNVICVAFFIPTEFSNAIFETFFGDNRDFSWDSAIDRSRAWVWIDADTGQIIDKQIHYTEDANTQEKWVALQQNTIKTQRDANGTIKMEYSFWCSAPNPNCWRGPQGEITFTPNRYGTFDTTGNVEGFPNIEAYHWRNGQPVSMLFQVQNFTAQERANGTASVITGSRMGGFGDGRTSILTDDDGPRFAWQHQMTAMSQGLTVDFSNPLPVLAGNGDQ